MNSKIQIIYAEEKHFPSFHQTLDAVAREHIYIEMLEAPTLEKLTSFQNELIAINGPVYYALDDDQVVGWCDVFPSKNPRLNHRGGLGMGILATYRGQGIGSQLLSAIIDHSKKFGLEKIELEVYTTNTGAIALYKKFKFVEEGLIKNYRKLGDRYFDCLSMAKFL